MKLSVSAISDIGNVRSDNEDMILVGNEMVRNASKNCEFDFESSEYPFLISIADGMGGHKGGKYASEFVIKEMNNTVRALSSDLSLPELKNFLGDKIHAIHSKLLDEGLNDIEKTGMGSTFIGLLFFKDSIFLINIGDSRMYRMREGMLTQLSRDHSLSELTNNPDAPKNIILNSFGASKNIFFDFENISERIMENDKIILCSDGLNGELTDEEIENIISNSLDPLKLIDAVKAKVGIDNISVIIVSYEK